MENVSKALIIAGAILIAILLISIGIVILNAVNKPIEHSGIQADAQAVELFNSKFSSYFGKGKTAASVKTLITLVNTSNGVDSKHYIELRGITSTNSVNSSKTYKVTPAYYRDSTLDPLDGHTSEKGYLCRIVISEGS